MTFRKSALVLAFALAASLSAHSTAGAQDVRSLSRVGTELARFNKPGALYGYLKSYHPKFFEIADEAGLAAVLDGSLSQADFEAAFAAKLAAAGLSAKDGAPIRADAKVFKKVLGSMDRAAPRLGVSAEDMKKGDVVPELRKELYDAKKHWISESWSDARRGSVSVHFVPGKVVWFNPSVSIPELGIRAGVPLTEEQKKAVAELFSFETVPGKANPDGTAAFPEGVGRAINPNSHVVTVINGKGEVISDLVAKGGGPNEANTYRDGRLDYSEALMDSEISRNISRAGVRNYDALVVIQPDGLQGKAITVRAPRTMLRHNNFDDLSDDELEKTLARLTHETAIREGLKSLSISDWAKTYLPRVSGENWGILSGLGIEHGSNGTRDNHGVGETVDWGWAALSDKGSVDQRSNEWEELEKTLNVVNKVLKDGEKVVIDDAKKVFDAAFDKGQKIGQNERVRFAAEDLEQMDQSDLRTLADKTGNASLGYGASTKEAIDALKSSDHTVEMFDYTRLVGLPLSQLVALARHNGIAIPKGAPDRADLVASLTGKQASEVRRELVAETPAGPHETAGFSQALRDLLDARARDATRTDKAAVGR